jgi:uncharacterized OB-fold protein
MIVDAPSPEFSGFFENAHAGRLCFPRCHGCEAFHWYPMPRCPHCRDKNWDWHKISGVGKIYSFTSVRHAFDKERASDLPYTVALITFADAPGVRLVSNIVDEEAANLQIGQAVEWVHGNPFNAQPVVMFRLAEINMEARP